MILGNEPHLSISESCNGEFRTLVRQAPMQEMPSKHKADDAHERQGNERVSDPAPQPPCRVLPRADRAVDRNERSYDS